MLNEAKMRNQSIRDSLKVVNWYIDLSTFAQGFKGWPPERDINLKI
jgi:hypothetical protein